MQEGIVDGTVPCMLKFHISLQGPEQGLNGEALAQQHLVGNGHEIIAPIDANTSQQLQPASPQPVEARPGDSALVSRDPALEPDRQCLQRHPVIGVAG